MRICTSSFGRLAQKPEGVLIVRKNVSQFQRGAGTGVRGHGRVRATGPTDGSRGARKGAGGRGRRKSRNNRNEQSREQENRLEMQTKHGDEDSSRAIDRA